MTTGILTWQEKETGKSLIRGLGHNQTIDELLDFIACPNVV